MAEITLGVVKIGNREPVGTVFEQVFHVPIVSTAAGQEWFTTDFSFVESCVSHVVLGATARNVNIVLREEGTDGGETANNAVVGVEANGGATVVFTVRGR